MKKRIIYVILFVILPLQLICQTPVLLKDIYEGGRDVPLNGNDYDGQVYNHMGKLYFSGYTDDWDLELYVSDGTGNGTHLLYSQPDTGTIPNSFYSVGNLLFFKSYDEDIWVTDGTGEGTHLVKDINPTSSSFPCGFTSYHDKLYFWANDGTYGHELWTSDGTEEGTYMVKDINAMPGQSQSSSNAYDLAHNPPIIYNDLIFFNANDYYDNNLWVSDGTQAGTYKFHDVRDPAFFAVYNEKLYFSSHSGVAGQQNNGGLWVTDGTAEGTHLIQSFNSGVQDLFVANGKLYFYGSYSELWVTDGTMEGTHLVADINQTAEQGGQSYWYTQNRPGLKPIRAEFNDKLYFTAFDGVHGPEMWVTDGTMEGTHLVIDITTGNEMSSGGECNGCGPYNYTVLNGKLYFRTNDNEFGHQLWVTEGTAETTHIIIPDNPRTDALEFTQNIAVLNDNIYYSAYYDPDLGSSIYHLGINMSTDEITHESEISIYPNPTESRINFSEEMKVVVIYSINGERMASDKNSKSINISSLNSGVYFVKAITQTGKYFHSKFIKK